MLAIEYGLGVLPRSLFDTSEFRVQFFLDKAGLSHCFPRSRLGLLEPFPMYMAFPCSEYYGSSDFSKVIYRLLVWLDLESNTSRLFGCFKQEELSRSLLLTYKTSSHMPGSWTPPGLTDLALTVQSDIGFHVIKRVAHTGIHIFRGSITSRHLRHSGLCDSLHTFRVVSSPS